MTSPATQEPCPKCGGDRYLLPKMLPCDACKAVLCPHTTYGNRCSMHPNCPCNTAAPPSQRAELLTREQLRVHQACVEVINHAPFRQDISELINAARALSDAYAALTQRVSTLTEAQVNAVCHAVCDQCVRIDEPDKPPCTTENCAAMRAAHEALAAYRALSQEPRNG